MTTPRVSCLLVTQNGRERFVRRAVADFFAQRYGNKELVVVAEGPVPVPEIAGLTRVVHVEAPRPILGDLRNLSVELARGDLVAIWDDDDRSAPLRLQEQVDRLLLVEGDACFVSRIQLRCACGTITVSSERLWECTMLAWRKALPRYRALHRREDSVLVETMATDGRQFGRLDKPLLFTKVFHGNNTWDSVHNQHLFEQATPVHACQALQPVHSCETIG